jgi:hypothetical protein
LAEREKKIHDLAKTIGFARPNYIKVVIGNAGSSPAATGTPLLKSVVIMPPEYLLKPEELPEHLKLSKLDAQEITEDQWIKEFEQWLPSHFVTNSIKKAKSKFEIDSRRMFMKVWLQLFRNQDVYNKSVEFILGHELAHIKNCDGLKAASVCFAWDMLSFATGGIIALLSDKVTKAASRGYEKAAEKFSANKTGNGQAGSLFFQYILNGNKSLLNKYPELRHSSTDSSHPSEVERIRYLTTK